MNFVTLSDFDIEPYNLPAGDVKSTNFIPFMDREEERVLRKYLGHSLYNELIADGLYLPEQRLSDLIDGADYVISDVTYQWAGLNKMLVPYLYFVRTKHTLDSHTSTGIESAEVENGIKKSPRQRMSDAWNEFADAYGACKQNKNSLCGFINTNLVDYPTFIYSDPKRMNPYGL